MYFDKERISPPGQHPYDPPRTNVDPLAYAIERLQTYLIWSDEHRASYVEVRNIKPSDADNEMNCLKDAIEHAILHLQRLTELVLSGQGIDPKKNLPKNLCGDAWNRAVEGIAQHRPEKDGVE